VKIICVIGAGYVGLVTGTCFADLGNRVTCVDINEGKIATLNAGRMPIFEPGLEEMVRRNVKAGRLFFTTSYAEGLKDAEFVFIAVGTPSGVDGEADLQYVRMAAEGIAEHMDHPMIIVNKSTVPVGTGDWVADIIRRKRPDGPDFAVVSNPEFLREGSAISDFLNPDRVVLGSLNPEAAEKVAQLHLPLRAPIVITDLRTAEMIKYASNAFLATRISFINEIASICERLGADVKEVAAGMGYDKRIGHQYLDAGVGYGGSCFAADTSAFVLSSSDLVVRSFDTLFEERAKAVRAGKVDIVDRPGMQVLAFDLDRGKPSLAEVKCLTRRWYKGPMVRLETRMGRRLRVTADHPIVVYDPEVGAFRVKLANAVQIGDKLVAVTALPSLNAPHTINLLDKLEGREPERRDGFALLSVTRITREEGREYVYSMETETSTLITASGLVAHNCFPKDVKALEYMASIHGCHPQLLRAVMEINRDQRRQVIQKLRDLLGGSLQDKVVGLLGLAFKPNTDDMREAPSIEIAHLLQHEGARVKAYDPVAMENAKRELPDAILCADPYELAEGCDAIVVVTEWNEFKHLDMARIRPLMRRPVIIDGRNIYEPTEMQALGFIYRGVGRGYGNQGSGIGDR